MLLKPHGFVAKAVAAAALAAPGMSAHATAPFVVQDIKIEGLQRVEAGSVFAYLPLKQGETFTDEKASEAIRALYATGFFTDVRVATQGGVVIVQVQERPAIASIDFTGIKEFDKDNLNKALKAVGLAQGRYYDKA
ncbi:POTRA domain-containing protein, partial [Burkholderia sp. MSMB175]